MLTSSTHLDVWRRVAKLVGQGGSSIQYICTRPHYTVQPIFSSRKMLQHQQKPRLSSIRTSSVYGDDVSPPDSPRTTDGRRLSTSPNISPVTDAGSTHRFPQPRTSNIPLPRQPSNGGTVASISGWREKIAAAQAAGADGKIKWDSYSGDPTGNAAGMDSTIRPRSKKLENFGSSTEISALQQPRPSLFGVSLKKSRKDPALPQSQPQPKVKEEWKGTSRGSPMLPSVEQKPNPTKQFFPSPMQRRQKGGFRQAIGLKPQGQNGSSRPQPAHIDTQPHTGDILDESEVETPTAETPIENRVIPPRGISINQNVSVPQRGATWAEGNGQGGRPQSLPPRKSATEPIPQVAEPIHRKPVTPRAQTPEPDIPTESMPKHDFNPGHISEAFAQSGMQNEPVNRSSAPTVGTTITEESSDEPELPRYAGSGSTPPESVMHRRRPIQASTYLPRSQNPARKPTPSERDLKSLPTTPADETAVDRVTLLEAKLSTLNKRKAGLQTVIDELTNVVQPNSLVYDNASRQEIKRTVESFQKESAAVAKEIHDTGLKLHRAMKKRDDASAFEPTGLWVRRVTE